MEREGGPMPQRQKISEKTGKNWKILVIQRIQMVPPTFLALLISLEMRDFLVVLRHFEGNLDPFDVRGAGTRQDERPQLFLAISAEKRHFNDLFKDNTL